jgi:zinc and cadmium transporter
MNHDFVLLAYYTLITLLMSLVGGQIPSWVRLTHRGMEIAVSFVAGVMLGIGVLHMLPHAMSGAAAAASASGQPLGPMFVSIAQWFLSGFLVMFFIERFLCFHHHDAPESEHNHTGAAAHDHVHDVTWSGAAMGLTLHSVLSGVALAASVEHGGSEGLAGFGTFLVVALHKPFDSLTIATLMNRSGWSRFGQQVVNGLFALAIPLGVLLFYGGLLSDTAGTQTTAILVAKAIAFSAGTFLCIATSDLLPELQFHQHDRLLLSAALVAGLLVAFAAAQLEQRFGHQHVKMEISPISKLGALDCECNMRRPTLSGPTLPLAALANR